MVLVALTLLFVAIVVVVVWWYSRRSRGKAASAELQVTSSRNSKLEARASSGESDVPEPFRTLWPLIRHLAAYNRLLPLPGVRERYTHQIDRAGLRFELSADEFLAIKEITALVMAGVALLVYSAVIQNWMIAAALGFIGVVYPDLRLSAAVKKQEYACLRALPGFLDLLALAVEAGLGFDSAVRKLTEVLQPGPLIWRLQAFLRSMNVGKPRSEALKEMARKLDMRDFTAFANAVIQATETGASMGPVLRTESGEMLFRRFERAEKAGYELPIKILFPLFAFVFPATFLMILGPLYFQFKASGAIGAF
jgi:tight adherence protein C